MSEPIYKQIEKYLKDLIASGEIKPGELLPTESQISEQFKVTRMTVRPAFNTLVKEGYIKRQRGIGSVVVANKIHDNIATISSFTQELKSKGYEVKTHLISLKIMPADNQIATALHLEEDENVWEIKRVREANGTKVSYMITYMPVKLFPNLNEKHCIDSLYDYVEQKCGCHIARADRQVEAVLSTKELQSLLELEGEVPMLYIHQTAYLDNEEPFEYSQSYYYGYRLTLKVVNL